MFRRKKKKREPWHCPTGETYRLYSDMATQPHLLVGGATGSGKSVVINGIIATLLYDSPAEVKFILIDPKRVELIDYKNIPHTIAYASEPEEMVSALRKAMDITEARYQEMQRKREKKYSGADLYVIIDELADLMTTDKKRVLPLLQRLCQIGRAARVHVIGATQCPLATVIPTPLKVNFDSRVALRTRSKQDSRNLLEQGGCELLPRYGQGYYMKPGECELWNIPMVEDEEIHHLCEWWEKQR